MDPDDRRSTRTVDSPGAGSASQLFCSAIGGVMDPDDSKPPSTNRFQPGSVAPRP